MAEFTEEVERIVEFLSSGQYPSGLDKNLKRSLRRKVKFFSLHDGNLFYRERLVVASSEKQQRKIQFIHTELGAHLGRDRTYENVAKRYYWPGIQRDVKEFVKRCDACQITKSPATLHPMPVYRTWDQVGLDMIGPLNETPRGNKYIITLCDYFSKWPVAEAVADKSSQTVAMFLYKTMTVFGCIKTIITDEDQEFVNEVNQELVRLTGAEHRITSAYHPQINGLKKRFSQTLQRSLSKVVNDKQNDWDEHVDAVLFGYRTSVHASTGFSPFYIMYGREPILPIDLNDQQTSNSTGEGVDSVLESMMAVHQAVAAQVLQNIQKAQAKQKRHQTTKRFSIGENAPKATRKRGKLEPKWTGPCIVTEVHEKGLYSLTDAQTNQTPSGGEGGGNGGGGVAE